MRRRARMMWRWGLWTAAGAVAVSVACVALRPTGVVERKGGGEVVVVLHGLNRTSRAMEKMAAALAGEGYTVLNCNYPSTAGSVAELTQSVQEAIAPRVESADAVHFVTHSMGGIVVRVMAQAHPLPNMGRVVMLGPPNQGSELVDALGSWRAYRWVNGAAGNELGTATNATVQTLGAPTFELGIIAGDRSLNPLFSWLIPGKDDGKVSVERTKLEGMADFVCLHVTHTWMMRNSQVIRQTLHFLKNGRFESTEAPSADH